MKHLDYGLVLGAVLVIVSGSVPAATTIMECVDTDGSVSFRDSCPPGMLKKGERRYASIGTNRPASNVNALPPITLFSVTDCDPCDLVRNVLSTRALSFDEKDVEDNAENQQALRDATGALNVPTVLIGENIVSGYNRTAIEAALKQAGFQAPPETE